MKLIRYRSFNEELKKQFGARVDRITINAFISCPNIDGTKARGGCTFCQDASFEGLTLRTSETFLRGSGIADQIQQGITYLGNRYPSLKYLAYFQNGTNTYAPIDVLQKNFHEALKFPEVVGLIISTRPDCLSSEIIDLLTELNQTTYLWVELGIPSHLDESNRRVNRAHTVDDFVQSTYKLAERSIRVCAHVILGLIGEDSQVVIEKARFMSAQNIQAIKIHNLVVFKDTALEKIYREERYPLLSLSEYANQCVDFLENLRSDIFIQRLNAHGPKRLTVAPAWSVNKWNTINAIHSVLEERDTWQGKFLDKPVLTIFQNFSDQVFFQNGGCC
ncbi:MAG: TIGR01212 family radical SAM protein [Deltaproteobacteria bacterium RIFCSPLOWO2_12_FULL_40_28]|nr:MAG: TIGR01212 family radical SAM protein [Deltaproteobacteria bacterium RIFCSPHIGHO2_02_FULL_40_28]OGQ20074.1 MAG: TIGR01212 family radical SAM protein [Deltaproteobacteria bacterium RIFCSPHIGHO2_12_FULL_40_32]OGQ40641.1 MAG: TIGR01212 family radical SAM protein [Deltaproteobacteria bacterium RIFCSPLOWO2_02_FULL_40_36]OGQ54310.1 MAG: TIGR01212 family radical SAM protein [Deltaproteobacteria bacterium RIFCSPLOWO2_12_FULL_40_28]